MNPFSRAANKYARAAQVSAAGRLAEGETLRQEDMAVVRRVTVDTLDLTSHTHVEEDEGGAGAAWREETLV